MKILKIVGGIVAVLVVIAVGAAAWIAATFDPEKYKPELVALVKEKTGRTLSIDGKLGVTFFPTLGVSASGVKLSEPGSDKRFASVAEARLSLALMPLLSREVVVDRVVLGGLNADVVRGKDGRLNIDDLTGGGSGPAAGDKGAKDKGSAEKSGGTPMKLDIAGIEIRADHLGWRDEQAGSNWKVSALTLKTGRISDGAQGKLEFAARIDGTQPKVGVNASLASGYRVNFTSKAFALTGMAAKMEGDVPGAAGLSANLKGDIEADGDKGGLQVAGLSLTAKTRDGIDATVNLPKLSISEKGADASGLDATIKIIRGALSLDAKLVVGAAKSEFRPGARTLALPKLALEYTGKQGDLALQGKLATPVALNLDAKTVLLSALSGELSASGPSIPNKSMKITLDGQLSSDWGRQTAAGNLTAKLDESTLQAKVNVAGFAQPSINFDVALDKLNADRYMPAKGAAGGGGAGAGGSGGGGKAADAPIDLSALKTLALNGQLRIGELVASKVKVEKLQVGLRAAGGKLEVNPLSANLYGGTLAGTATVTAAGAGVADSPNRFALRQMLGGVNIGPLLRDLADKDVLEGKGNVTVDVQAMGATVGAVKRGLEGTASLSLKDGALKGINLAESFRKVKSVLGAKSQEQGAVKGEKTDFSELSASFVIRGGVAHNEDLSAKSPFFRLGGAGDIDIGGDKMDYLAKAAIVNTAGGQGARELNELRGLTVPVRISGPFDALKYRIDIGAAATEAVKQQVQEKVQEKVKEQVQDRLKGLLRR